jgi:PAS domain S-box-containing protein
MRNIKYFFLTITITALSFALITIYLIIPEFKRVIIDDTEVESLRISENLYPVVIDETKNTLKNASEFAVILETERKRLNIKKIKVYSNSGEIVYSSDLKEIGTINPKIPIIEKGSTYSELVEKGGKTVEGEKVTTYVVETYVPIYKENNLLGYFEIYHDVSNILTSINKVTTFSLKIQTSLLLAFLILSLIFILGAERYRLKKSSTVFYKSPPDSAIKNILFVALSIFVAEFIVMLIIDALRIKSDIGSAIYDSTFLTLLLAPTLYLFVFKPLKENINFLEKTKEELNNSNKLLNEVANGINESILLLTPDLKVIWANKAAINEIGLSPIQIAGDYCYRLTHHLEQPCRPPLDPCPIKKILEGEEIITFEHTHFDRDNKPIYVEVSAYPIKDNDGRITKFVHISRDITEKKMLEKERERLISELQEALRNIKTLEGLIPICANCKKIRNDEGFWTHFETYIKEHSDVQFSHGICPECMKKLYPEHSEKIEKRQTS